MRPREFLVFDIETSGKALEEFDESQQEYLLRSTVTEEEREQKIREFALSPFTAEVVAIGIAVIKLDKDRYTIEKEGVLAMDPAMASGEQRSEKLQDNASMIVTNERDLLLNFWKMLQHFPTIHLVSFNGRGFDAPFLMLRSAVFGIRPSRNLMEGSKWNYPWHTDLADELSYFGYQTSGPQRRFNFDFYARAFGITSPKSQGIDGSVVADFFRQGRLREIAEYCLRDVRATWELYQIWEQRLRFDRR